MSTVRRLLQTLDSRYPLARAEEWDSVGLLVGDPNATVHRALVAHEITPHVLREAEDCEAIVTYHPMLFRPLARLDFSDPTAKLAGECIRRGLNIIAAHTALDNAPKGTALGDELARQLELQNVEVLNASEREHLYQIAVYVPIEAVEIVSRALWDAGAGRLGNYSEASFGSSGTGTFRPLDGARPAIGAVGELERVNEIKLEVLVPEAQRDAAVGAMKAAHPYEEVAYAVYALHNMGHSYGAARVGELPNDLSLEAFALNVGEQLGAPNIRLVKSGASVRKVACVPGSGASFIGAAARAGGDVLVTGDIKHHDALKAQSLGLSVVDTTHVATERAAVTMLAQALADVSGIEVTLYEGDTNPFSAL